MTTPDNAKQMRPVPGSERQLPCEDIQALMLDYMHRGLGEGRSDLVREHTRRCTTCHERAIELQKTLGILHDAPFAHGTLPQHLSQRHHSRLVRALMHPVLDWIYMHHILVSALVAAIVIASVFFGLRRYRVWRDTIEPGIPVVIGTDAE
ncbi:MAG: zf-HC2 domain-containing protein [Kiritimatiellae bacterium]|nr:zf-HC2 domain-containing protein [Kiritimatiellia bacterium]